MYVIPAAPGLQALFNSGNERYAERSEIGGQLYTGNASQPPRALRMGDAGQSVSRTASKEVIVKEVLVGLRLAVT